MRTPNLIREERMTLNITILGGGMIVHDQILPSIYHMQRVGQVGEIQIVATRSARLRDLISTRFTTAFPGQTFHAQPSLDSDHDAHFPNLWRDALAAMSPRQLVIIATPDELHYDMVMTALNHDQHVLCVKPLVHTYAQAKEIETLADSKGLFVGVEYHKRFDRRSLEARDHYQQGRFGEFRCGEAKLIEPWSYRHSNFQNWFTKDKTDPFTYIGCHYVDLVHFITGLKPISVAAKGIEGTFPNGNEAYMWSAAQVTFENGGILSVINGLGYPDKAAGSNDQGMCLFCEDADPSKADDSTTRGAVIRHDDQFRGVSYSFTKPPVGEKSFYFVNPDYFRLVPFDGEGLKPVGYGYDSIEANVQAVIKLEAESTSINTSETATNTTTALSTRRDLLAAINKRGLIATPANSSFNEQTIEAARISILNNGKEVNIPDH
jgi:D-galacturonate reductase